MKIKNKKNKKTTGGGDSVLPSFSPFGRAHQPLTRRRHTTPAGAPPLAPIRVLFSSWQCTECFPRGLAVAFLRGLCTHQMWTSGP